MCTWFCPCHTTWRMCTVRDACIPEIRRRAGVYRRIFFEEHFFALDVTYSHSNALTWTVLLFLKKYIQPAEVFKALNKKNKQTKSKTKKNPTNHHWSPVKGILESLNIFKYFKLRWTHADANCCPLTLWCNFQLAAKLFFPPFFFPVCSAKSCALFEAVI